MVRARSHLANPDAERALLSIALGGGARVVAGVEDLSSDDFADPRHAVIYETIAELEAASALIDIVTVSAALNKADALRRAGGATYLTEIDGLGASSHAAGHYADLVLACSTTRRVIEIAHGLEASTNAKRPIGDTITKAIAALTDLACRGDRGGPRHIREPLKKLHAELEDLRSGKKKPGITTGFPDLDHITYGFRPPEMTVLGARPSMGKTALALHMALAAAKATDKAVLIVSLEQADLAMVRRIIAFDAPASATRLATGTLKQSEWPRMANSFNRLHESRIWIDDSASLSVAQLSARAHRLHAKHSLGLIMVDYMQIIKAARTYSREREIAGISSDLKTLCKELHVPGLILSQLSRSCENREDKEPRLSDFRDSGSIEQDADVVLSLYRPDYYDKDDRPGEAHLSVLKGRDCGTGKVLLGWERELLKFTSLTKERHGEG
jgi:replicative DNA helicase